MAERRIIKDKENRPRKILRGAFLFALSAWIGAGGVFAAVEAPDLELMRQENAYKQDSETKIQSDILDPILGKEKAKVFVDIDLEVMAQRRENVRAGAGMADRYKEKPGAKGFMTQFILPGVPKPKNISGNGPPEKPAASQEQSAAQQKEEKDEIYGLKTIVKRLLITVIHDDSISKDKLDLVRSRIVDAMSKFKAMPDQVVFRPTRFNSTRWIDDLRRPNVYIPLIYAVLLMLLLSFLFGPLAKFMRRIVDAMLEKKKMEMSSKQEQEQKGEMSDKGDGKGKGGKGEPEESKLDIMVGQKPPEPPPEPVPAEDEDAMKKFEPFTYVNEENLKRLANLFLLRRYEPWLVAVIMSYLKVEYSRKILGLLPIDLQSKVALEALMVRQVTREQLIAIDMEVKENIDFVVGGLEKLVNMIDEADILTRQNILEYLKNEKPIIYERVRKQILMFEDISRFPDRDMQKIIRELKTEQMSKALQGAAPEVLNKFLTNMSGGAAMLLKESMEFGKGLGQVQIDEERGKIMDVIKTMDREGKIAVRPSRSEDDFQEELAMNREERYGAPKPQAAEAPAAAPGGQDAPGAAGKEARPLPAAAEQTFQAAVQSYTSGNLDDCVNKFRQVIDADPNRWEAYQYLGTVLYQMGRYPEALIYYEKLLEYNPNPQLKEWVDAYKAQVSTPAP